MERGKEHEYEILLEIGVVSVNSQFLIYVQIVKYRNKYKGMWTCMYVCVCTKFPRSVDNRAEQQRAYTKMRSCFINNILHSKESLTDSTGAGEAQMNNLQQKVRKCSKT